jgi:hypothetical protein
MRALQWCYTHKRAVIVDGPPGGGKTTIAVDAALGLTHTDGKPYGVKVFHPVTDEPVKYGGQPWVITEGGKQTATHLPYDDLRELIEATRPLVVVFDDLGNAMQSVQATMTHLALARHVGQHKISPYVTFAFLTNRKEDKTFSLPIIEALKTRCKMLHLETDPEDLIEYGVRHGFHPMVLAYIKSHPQVLDGWKGSVVNENSVTPRTIEELSKCMLDAPDDDIAIDMYSGDVGPGCAGEIMAYMALYNQIARVEDVIADPKGVALPDNASNLYALICALAFKANEGNVAPIMEFASRLSGEYEVLLAQDMAKRNAKLLDTKVMIAWMSKHKTVQFVM